MIKAGDEGRRGHPLEAPSRLSVVVVNASLVDNDPCLGEGHEQFPIKQLVVEPAMEALDETVFPGPSLVDSARAHDRLFRKTDGVGFFPHERLSPLPVFKVGKALSGTASGNSLENKGESFPRASATAPRASGPRRRNRVKPSHHKPNRDHSRDKSATSRDRPVSK